MFIGIPGMSLTITDLINLEGIIYYDIPGIPINIYEQNFLLNGIQLGGGKESESFVPPT